MQGTLRLGRIGGIDIGLHLSWFIIAALLVMSLATHLYLVNPDWRHALVWTAAVTAALAFFAAILAHELAHAAVAKARGLAVPSITLFAFGGLARMSRDTADPRTELLMGLAGPIVSVAIGLTALALARATGWDFEATPESPGMAMLVWFGFINLTLAAFNMIPGFPLDGGRVLRAIVWWVTGNQARATRIAAYIGQAVAVGFIVFGFMSFAFGGGFGGLWLAFIGLFLVDAARASLLETTLTDALQGVRVSDVMARDCAFVDRHTPIADVTDRILRTGQRCFFLTDDGHVAGLVTPHDLRHIDRDEWPATPVSAAMRPLERLHHVEPETPVTDALETIGREGVNQLPVIDHGQVQGVISREHILRLLASRAELTM